MTAVLPAPRDGVATHYLSGTGLLSAPTLNLLAPPTGPVDLNNQRLTGLPAPLGPTDGVPKTYADALSAGLDPKDSVRVATTANITLSGAQTIDGVAAIAGNRVLVKNQTTASQNGIYVVASGAWSRSADANSDPLVTAGLYVFVEEGAQADTAWVLTTNNPITLGTTALSFTQFSGGGGGGGTVTDQTIAVTDNAVNDVAVGRHGWAPRKTRNYKGDYLAGDNTWTPLYSPVPREWFVDANIGAGGDGSTRRTAYNTFAGVLASASPHDIVYVCSDLQENISINVQGLHLVGVGRPILNATASTALNNYTVNVTALGVSIKNFLIRGHSGFRGVHLFRNQGASYGKTNNVRIEGAGLGGAVTFYPTTPNAGTGIGGVGMAFHMCDVQRFDDIEIASCSIGIAAGTWCTRLRSKNVDFAGNAQTYVEGINTGAAGAPAATGPWAYGGAAQNGANHFEDWTAVSPYLSSAITPTFDLIGDGSTNSSAISGSLFEAFSFEESGGGQVIFRIGTADNTLVGCAFASPCEVRIQGQHNLLTNTSGGNIGVVVYSDFNVFDGFRHGFAQSAYIYGPGNFNTFRNIDLNVHPNPAVKLDGSGNMYERCRWIVDSGAPAMTRAKLGPYPTIIYGQGFYAYTVTGGTTITPGVSIIDHNSITVTDTTPWTIANPLDGSNISDLTKIMVTNPQTFDILNSSGSTMGNITWGSKYVLASAIVKPLTGKHLVISFRYNYTLDQWIESDRVLHT